jgi:uncharacterized protein (DUF2252 family)
MASAIEQIRAFNADREPERLALKYASMRRDAFAFFRGTCHLFYAEAPKGSPLHDAPLAWLCGDLHLENFGTYRADNRLTYFDLNDFDEACLGPASLDVYRWLTSILVGFRAFGGKRNAAITLASLGLQAYGATLATEKARWVERATAKGLVRDLFRGLRHRKLPQLLEQRTELHKGRRFLRLGRRALPVTDEERERVIVFLQHFGASVGRKKYFRPLDVARRVAGTGSLGVPRYVVLIEGKGSPNGNHLLDLKAARPSVLPLHDTSARAEGPWATEAERIVFVQRRMQAVSPAALHAVMLDGEPFVLKELQPTEDRVDVQAAARDWSSVSVFTQILGRVLGWGQLRSAGRKGAAEEDALGAFGRDDRRLGRLLDLAVHASERVESDYRAFREAYDDGAFSGRARS